MKKKYLIVGASRGIGLAMAERFSADSNLEIFSLSRSPSPWGTWLKADLQSAADLKQIGEYFKNQTLDAVLFLGGTWENKGFTSGFDFLKSNFEETEKVLRVNLIAPIHLAQVLAPALAKSENPKFICVGTLSGLDRSATPEVANTASKAGLRGAMQALQVALRQLKIGFSVINPGNVATEEVKTDIRTGIFLPQTPIPMEDFFLCLEMLLKISRDSNISEINLEQMKPSAKLHG